MKLAQNENGTWEVWKQQRSKRTLRMGWHVVFKSGSYQEALDYLRANRPNPCQA